MKTKLYQNKYFNFFLPIPSLCILIFFVVICIWSTIGSVSITVSDCFLLIITFFILFIIPLDIVLWIIKKLYEKWQKKGTHNKQDEHLYSQKNSSQTSLPPTFIGMRDKDTISENEELIHHDIRYRSDIKAENNKKGKNDLNGKEIKARRNTSISNQDHTIIIKSPSDTNLKGIAQIIYSTYREFGINISISKASVYKHQVIYHIAPLSGVRSKTIFSLKDDVALRLGTEIDMEMFSSIGCIGIIIPIDYFFHLPESIYNKINSMDFSVANVKKF